MWLQLETVAGRKLTGGGLFDVRRLANYLKKGVAMDGNLIGMIISLGLYVLFLGIASVRKINLGFIAIVCVLLAFWFGYQWNSFIGILLVLAGVVIGVIILRFLVGNRAQ